MPYRTSISDHVTDIYVKPKFDDLSSVGVSFDVLRDLHYTYIVLA